MSSWASVASSLSFANWFSDDESLHVGGRVKSDARRADGRQTKSLLDTPDSAASPLRVDAVLPPILIRGPGGQELDTETTYQRSIRKAKVKYLLGLPLTSSEWRLPHAAAPSRPDYSRVVPAAAKLKKLPPMLERHSPAEQAAAAANSSESLNQPSPRAGKTQSHSLPPVERKAYAPFVTCSAVHERHYQHDDVRAVLTDYVFPGWCYGCRLLYEGSDPAAAAAAAAAAVDGRSYDPFRDRPVRVGGGYAYVARALKSDGGYGGDGGGQRESLPTLAPVAGAATTVKKALSALDLRTIDSLPRVIRSVRGKHVHLLQRNAAWDELPPPAGEQRSQAKTGDDRDADHNAIRSREQPPAAAFQPMDSTQSNPVMNQPIDSVVRETATTQGAIDITENSEQHQDEDNLTASGTLVREENADDTPAPAADASYTVGHASAAAEERRPLSTQPRADSRISFQSRTGLTSGARASETSSIAAAYGQHERAEQAGRYSKYLANWQELEAAEVSPWEAGETDAALQLADEKQLESIQSSSRSSLHCSPALFDALASAPDREDEVVPQTAESSPGPRTAESREGNDTEAASPSSAQGREALERSTTTSDHELEQEQPATEFGDPEQNVSRKRELPVVAIEPAAVDIARAELHSPAHSADFTEIVSSERSSKVKGANAEPPDNGDTPSEAVPVDPALAEAKQPEDLHPVASSALDDRSFESAAATSQPSLEDLLHNAVQVSSWRPDTVTATVVTTAQQCQQAQTLTPNVISIPPDQNGKKDAMHLPSLDATAAGEATMPSPKLSIADLPNIVEDITPATVSSTNAESSETAIAKAVVGSPEKMSRLPAERYGSPPTRKRKPKLSENKHLQPAAPPVVPTEAQGNDTTIVTHHEEVSPSANDNPLPGKENDVPAHDSTEAAGRKKPTMRKITRRREKAQSDNAQNNNVETQVSSAETPVQQPSPIKTAAAPLATDEDSNRAGGAPTESNSQRGSAPHAEAAERSVPIKQLAEPPVTKRAGGANASVTTKQGAETTKKITSKAQRPTPAAPAEKPNFMHLLSIGTVAEDPPTDAGPSPIEDAPSSPEMDFVIHRDPTSPEPTPPPTPPPAVAEAPLELEQPPVEQPPPALPKKEPLPPPPPVSVGPPPQVVKKRMRALKLFESRSRVVSLVQRRSEISSPTKKELRGGGDPVDYLTKYCLINSDRLPYYERVFREVVTHQQSRFKFAASLTALASDQEADTTQESEQRKKEGKKEGETEHQRQLMRVAAQLPAHVPRCREPAINAAEFHNARVTYTLQRLQARYDQLVQAIEELEDDKNRAIASAAREAYPEILAADYRPQSGKRKKSPKPKKRSPSPSGRGRKGKSVDIPDGQVLERLSSAQKESLTHADKAIRGMTIRLERMEQQCLTAEQRAAELEVEREEMENWAKQLFVQQQTTDKMSAEFRQSQSQFFNRLHPMEDREMNLEELEYALQLINNHLITDKERKYIYYILDIPGTTRLSLKMFSCIAALSEKVHQLDPIVRKLINKLDYEALEIKMEACKEMFFMLADRSPHNGHIQLSDLSVELAAGGLSAEMVHYIIGRLDFLNTGQVEYLDYLMYIPLFMEIHQKIVKEPLTDRAHGRMSSAGK